MYVYANKNKIIKVSQRLIRSNPDIEYKNLVVEDEPTYDPETQILRSLYENGEEAITQKFKVVEKEVEESE